MSRVSNLKKNTIASLAYQILVIISGFILPRLFLTHYGSAAYGLIASITSFLGFVSLLDLGIGAIVSSNLYKPLAEKNIKEISRVISYCKKFYRVIASVLVLYVIMLMLFYPRIVQDSFSFTFVSSLVFVISLSSFAQYFIGITYTLLLKADQKQFIAFKINIVTLIINTIVSVILIYNGFSVHIVMFSTSIIFIFRPIVLSLYVNRNYKLIHNIKVKDNPIKQQWNGVAQHIAFLVQDKTDIVILTLFTSLENVSVYTVYYMITSAIRSFIYAATAGVSALVGNMLAHNEIDKLEYLFEKYQWLMHTVSTFLFTVTAILIVPFIKVYTKGINDISYVVPYFSVILCIALAFRCISLPYNIVVQAAIHFKETQNSAILEPLINIIISLTLVIKFGLIGVAVGTLVSIFYRTIYLAHYLSKNIIKISITKFYKQLCIDIIASSIMVMFTFRISIYNYSYLAWIYMAINVFFICLIINFIINFVFYRRFLLSGLKIIK